MLSTLAMFVTGVAVLAFSRSRGRPTELRVNVRVLGRDVLFFVLGYAIAIGTAFVPAELEWVRWVAAALLLLIYAYYVRLHFRDEPEETEPEELNQLHATRLPGMAGPHTLDIDILPGEKDSWEIEGSVPRMRIIVSQVVLALALIIVGAQVFVGAVEHLSTVIGLDPTILALIIAPIATELPEKFNSVLWVRTGKDTLAMGNITGAMVFQSCVPTVLGLLFTTWLFTPETAISFLSAGVAFVAVGLIFGLMRLAGPPLGMDSADWWSPVPHLRLHGPLHPPWSGRQWALAHGFRNQPGEQAVMAMAARILCPPALPAANAVH